MTKYLWAAILALSLALLGSGYALKRAFIVHGEQKAQIKGLERAAEMRDAQDARNRDLVVKAAAANRTAKAESAKAQVKLDAALSNARAWADEPLPQEVQDALIP